MWPKGYKTTKVKSLEIWKRKHLDNRADIIIADVDNRKHECGKWATGYVPNPSTYLNQERWNDDITPIRQKVDTPKNDTEWLELGHKINEPAKVGESMGHYRARLQTIHNGAQS
jgi:hypothetical protein